MERRYDASIAGVEPLYQPPPEKWPLAAQAKWVAQSCKPGAAVEPMPPVAASPSIKDVVALRLEIIQNLEGVRGDTELAQWICIFDQVEPLLGPPTIDLQSRSPGGIRGSWAHEILDRALSRPTPEMLLLASGLLEHWVPADLGKSDATSGWALLFPPTPVMEPWSDTMAERFDLTLLDASRKSLEVGLLPISKKEHTLAAKTIFSRLMGVCHAAASRPQDKNAKDDDSYFNNALMHLRLQAASMSFGHMLGGDELSRDALPQPQHVPKSFCLPAKASAAPVPIVWKTAACSVLDCLEQSRDLRAYLQAGGPSAQGHWSRVLSKTLASLPPEQVFLPLRRIEGLSSKPSQIMTPALIASLKAVVMDNLTPKTQDSVPRQVRRF